MAGPWLPSVDLSLGVLQIGSNFSSVLYGLSLVQTYLYFTNCVQDRRSFKLTVAGIALFETLNISFVWAYLYDSSITHFGVPAVAIPWQFDAALATHAIVGSVVQAFFVFRLYSVSHNIWLAIPAWSLILVRYGSTTLVAVVVGVESVIKFRERYNWAVYVSLTLSTIVDVYVTAGLCYCLMRRKTEYRATRDAINSIVLWTMETGLVTTVVSILIIAFYAASSTTEIWVALIFVYTRLYSNSLLVSLNGRNSVQRWRNQKASQYATSNSVAITRSIAVEMNDIESSSTGRRLQTMVNEEPSMKTTENEGSKTTYPFQNFE